MAQDVGTEILLAFLNAAWQHAADAANKLREQLLTEQVAATDLIARGSLGSISKNSSSQSYMGYGPGRLTHVQITETWTKLLNFYDALRTRIEDAAKDAEVALGADYDFDLPIYQILTKFLQAQGAADTLPDITRLRLPAVALNTPEVMTW